VQVKGDIDLQFGVDSTALSESGNVIVAATTDVYLQDVGQSFHYDPNRRGATKLFS
jgi:hypothetical protein